MALEKLVNLKYGEIDEEANSKKRVVSYFANLINSDYENFSKVFRPLINRDFESALGERLKEIENLGMEVVKKDFFENGLYHYVKNMIVKLSKSGVEFSGVNLFSEVVASPEVKLGYSEYIIFSDTGSFVKKLTEKGRQEIREYQKISGDYKISHV